MKVITLELIDAMNCFLFDNRPICKIRICETVCNSVCGAFKISIV